MLVNETYLKLSKSLPATVSSHQHFKRIAARAMRQVLVEAARRRGALKRGNARGFVTLGDAAGVTSGSAADVLAIDGALKELARAQPRLAQMIEYRFFGGFAVAEIAELLGVSDATVARDWRTAKAWLALELRDAT